MLRLAESRSDVGIVNDQIGNPTYAPHLAAGILTIAYRIRESSSSPGGLWGTYHAAGSGEATWYRLAREVFNQSERLGGPVTQVHPITTAEYPTPACRPTDSRLDCSKCASVFGVRLPGWTIGVAECVSRLVMQTTERGLATRTVGAP